MKNPKSLPLKTQHWFRDDVPIKEPPLIDGFPMFSHKNLHIYMVFPFKPSFLYIFIADFPLFPIHYIYIWFSTNFVIDDFPLYIYTYDVPLTLH